MPSIEERVAYLEGRFEDHMGAVDGVQQRIVDLREEMVRSFVVVQQQFEQVNQRFVQVDARFEQVDARFDQVDRRFEQVDRRFEQVDTRLVALDQKIDRHFTWLVGIQVAVLVSVVGALVGSYYR